VNKGPFVSVVICSHIRSADVLECLDALIPQIGPEAEVILVDSASDPKNEAELAKLANCHLTPKLATGNSEDQINGFHCFE
jgi:glycosyltransferase involved in cell wall biosynthesis